MTTIRLSAFRWVPPFAQGLVRDLRVRWALEEAGLAYEERLIEHKDLATKAYRELQPFGQVPIYEEDGLVLFESGAIVLHVANRSSALMPTDAAGRARATAWMFAALNSVEPPIRYLAEIDLFHAEEEWATLRRPGAVDAVKKQLAKLSDWLSERDYLEDRFTAADLLMRTVLRDLRQTDLVGQMPVLEAYQLRCQERAAFQRALAAQMATFATNEPG